MKQRRGPAHTEERMGRPGGKPEQPEKGRGPEACEPRPPTQLRAGNGEGSGGKRTEVILKYRKELQSLFFYRNPRKIAATDSSRE